VLKLARLFAEFPLVEVWSSALELAQGLALALACTLDRKLGQHWVLVLACTRDRKSDQGLGTELVGMKDHTWGQDLVVGLVASLGQTLGLPKVLVLVPEKELPLEASLVLMLEYPLVRTWGPLMVSAKVLVLVCKMDHTLDR
jgi:hypothetical protein